MLNFPKTIVFASRNVHKLAEVRPVFTAAGLTTELRSLLEFPDYLAEETAKTFVENALIKARLACQHTQLPAFADDSGLVVPVLAGLPGVHSARYAGTPCDHVRNNKKLLSALRPYTNEAQRKAYFCSVLVYCESADDPLPLIAQGIWRGQIAEALRGHQGFGYDPLFVPSDLNITAAELTDTQKQQQSHRSLALQQLCEQLQQRYHAND